MASPGEEIERRLSFSYVIQEEDVTDEILLNAVREVYKDREKYIDAMSGGGQMDSIGTILELIESERKHK